MLHLFPSGGCGKSEWEAFQKKFEKQGQEYRRLNRSRDTLQRKCDALERHNERLNQKWEDLVRVYNRMCEAGTPRPSFEPAHRILQTDQSDLGELGGSTRGMFTFMCAQLDDKLKRIQFLESKAPNDDPYFIGMGPGDDVPPYLRTKSNRVQIRNRRMPKRDVEQMIKQIWRKKDFSNKSLQRLGKQPLEMPEFFLPVLAQRIWCAKHNCGGSI